MRGASGQPSKRDFNELVVLHHLVITEIRGGNERLGRSSSQSPACTERISGVYFAGFMAPLAETLCLSRENWGSVHTCSFASLSYKGHSANSVLLICKLFLASRKCYYEVKCHFFVCFI